MNVAEEPIAAWVVGAGGLLGTAVRRALPLRMHAVPQHAQTSELPWTDAAACAAILERLAATFFTHAEDRPWMVLWCAGAGAVGVSEEALARETRIFTSLLEQLAAKRRPGVPGAIFFASSAGGVYAGSSAVACDEDTPPRPINPYGRAKLEQENRLAAWSTGQRDVSTLIGRISNLYGPGQNLHKPQGLISQLCRSVILGRAAHVYVPLDTRRDYLYADDCADAIGLGMVRLFREAAQAQTTIHVRKVLASERETSIASLLASLRRIAKRPVRIVVAPSPAARLQPHAIRLRSHVWQDLVPSSHTTLPVGIHRVWQDQLHQLRQGRLPLPAPG